MVEWRLSLATKSIVAEVIVHCFVCFVVFDFDCGFAKENKPDERPLAGITSWYLRDEL